MFRAWVYIAVLVTVLMGVIMPTTSQALVFPGARIKHAACDPRIIADDNDPSLEAQYQSCESRSVSRTGEEGGMSPFTVTVEFQPSQPPTSTTGAWPILNSTAPVADQIPNNLFHQTFPDNATYDEDLRRSLQALSVQTFDLVPERPGVIPVPEARIQFEAKYEGSMACIYAYLPGNNRLFRVIKEYPTTQEQVNDLIPVTGVAAPMGNENADDDTSHCVPAPAPAPLNLRMTWGELISEVCTDFDSSSSNYRVNVGSRVESRSFIGTVVECVEDSFLNMFHPPSGGESVFTRMQESFQDLIRMLLVLYVIIYGLRVITHQKVPSISEVNWVILRIALVMWFAAGSGMTQLYPMLVNSSKDISSMLLEASAGRVDDPYYHELQSRLNNIGDSMRLQQGAINDLRSRNSTLEADIANAEALRNESLSEYNRLYGLLYGTAAIPTSGSLPPHPTPPLVIPGGAERTYLDANDELDRPLTAAQQVTNASGALVPKPYVELLLEDPLPGASVLLNDVAIPELRAAQSAYASATTAYNTAVSNLRTALAVRQIRDVGSPVVFSPNSKTNAWQALPGVSVTNGQLYTASVTGNYSRYSSGAYPISNGDDLYILFGAVADNGTPSNGRDDPYPPDPAIDGRIQELASPITQQTINATGGAWVRFDDNPGHRNWQHNSDYGDNISDYQVTFQLHEYFTPPVNLTFTMIQTIAADATHPHQALAQTALDRHAGMLAAHNDMVGKGGTAVFNTIIDGQAVNTGNTLPGNNVELATDYYNEIVTLIAQLKVIRDDLMAQLSTVLSTYNSRVTTLQNLIDLNAAIGGLDEEITAAEESLATLEGERDSTADELASYVQTIDPSRIETIGYNYCDFRFEVYPPGKDYMRLWDQIDCKISTYLGIGMASDPHAPKSILVAMAAVVSSLYGLLIFFLSCIFLIFIIMLVLRIAHIYLLAFIALSLLVYISPLVIPSVLFEQTKSVFSAWLQELIGYLIQPIVLFGFLSLTFLIIDTVYFGENYFFNNENQILADGASGSSDVPGDRERQRCQDPDALGCMYQTVAFSSFPFISSSFHLFSFPTVDLGGGLGFDMFMELLKMVFICYVVYVILEQVENISARLAGVSSGGAAKLSDMKVASPHEIGGVVGSTVLKTGGAAVKGAKTIGRGAGALGKGAAKLAKRNKSGGGVDNKNNENPLDADGVSAGNQGNEGSRDNPSTGKESGGANGSADANKDNAAPSGNGQDAGNDANAGSQDAGSAEDDDNKDKP